MRTVYAIKKCEVCGAEYSVTNKDRVNTSKYCSMECVGKTQKGRKNPHSKEWEEKRLAAVREATKNKIFPKGYKRPREHTIGMINGHKKFREENPDKHREISIRNLSKNKTLSLSKENHPYWKGGITKENQKWRSENGKKFEKFRKTVLKRDGYKCKICGSNENLQVHHIISVSECRLTAFLPMNGVTLCSKCHKETETFGSKAINVEKIKSSIGGTIMCIARTIPHIFQAYNTCGNYETTQDGILVIFVSELRNEKYEWLIFLHEFIEANLCKYGGIEEKKITEFDLMFEKEREEGLHGEEDEPGDDIRAPYRRQHIFATFIEEKMAKKAGIDWIEYNKAINSL